MADVKWIKVTTNIFDDEKILLIESMPDAYAIITVWFKLLCLAGKQNNCGVFMMGEIPYTDKMLATIFRMKETTVAMALQTFENFGMIRVIDGVITIPNWEKHQSLDQLEMAKEQTRQRVARHREKQKQLAECNVTVTLPVTHCNGDRIEEDKKEIRSNTNVLQEKKKEKKPNGFAAILAGIEDERLRGAYLDYIEMRKTIKAPMTERALQMLINRVNELEASVPRQVQLLETAVLNNWKSVYSLRDEHAQPRAAQPTATDAFMDKLKSMYTKE